MTRVPQIEIHPVTSRAVNGGSQAIYRFANGRGASVVAHDFSYGGPHLWELAVVRFHSEDPDEFSLDYTTPVTDDVLGWLSDEDVAEHLATIAALPVAESVESS